MIRPILNFKYPNKAFGVVICFMLFALAVISVIIKSGESVSAMGGASGAGDSITSLLRSLLR